MMWNKTWMKVKMHNIIHWTLTYTLNTHQHSVNENRSLWFTTLFASLEGLCFPAWVAEMNDVHALSQNASGCLTSDDTIFERLDACESVMWLLPRGPVWVMWYAWHVWLLCLLLFVRWTDASSTARSLIMLLLLVLRCPGRCLKVKELTAGVLVSVACMCAPYSITWTQQPTQAAGNMKCACCSCDTIVWKDDQRNVAHHIRIRPQTDTFSPFNHSQPSFDADVWWCHQCWSCYAPLHSVVLVRSHISRQCDASLVWLVHTHIDGSPVLRCELPVASLWPCLLKCGSHHLDHEPTRIEQAHYFLRLVAWPCWTKNPIHK